VAPKDETRIQLCGRFVVTLEGRRVDDDFYTAAECGSFG
jgi:hypothetical protein